jgi:hypothetical protein
MTINVWNLRFLRGEMSAGGEPMIRADLSAKGVFSDGRANPVAGTPIISGTIKNVSGHVLTDLKIQVGEMFIGGSPQANTAAGDSSTTDSTSTGNSAGQWQGAERQWRTFAQAPVIVSRLGPGESANISSPLLGLRIDGLVDDGSGRSSYSYSYYNDSQPPPDRYAWVIARDLAARRSWRADTEARALDTAVVYATIADPKPPVTLRETGAKERHEAFLRALLPVKPLDERQNGTLPRP